MFVRFRTVGLRLQASLIEPRRVERKVRPEHIASLGSIPVEPSVADRVAFWASLHQRLGRLANRLDTAAQGKVLDEVHARIPMVTVEEQRALQLENAEADERFWHDLAEMQTEVATGNEEVVASAQRTVIEAKTQAENANKKAEAARDRVERLKRGEAVAGDLGKPIDIEAMMRDAGWTTADIEKARQTAQITKLGGEAAFEELLDEIHKRQRTAEGAATRAVLRRQVRQALAAREVGE